MKATSNQIFDAAVKMLAAITNAKVQQSYTLDELLDVPQSVIDKVVVLANRVADAIEDDSVMALEPEHIKQLIKQAYEIHRTETMPTTLLIENLKTLDKISRGTALAIIQRAEQDKLIVSEIQGKKTIYKLNIKEEESEHFEDDPNDPF